MADNTIRFDQIPRTSRLFNDFLYDFERVSRFYQPGGLDVSALVARAPKVAAQTFSRDAVADALADQNARAGASDQTFANIERLRQKDSVVVITGQQAGLFTGPLYTVFKALTVIKLAEHLRAQGLNVVPMFWVAAEDHDFEEVNHTRLLNREGQLVTITYAGCSPKEGKPVGDVKLNEKISDNIDEMIAALPESEFMPRLVEDLRDSYKAGANFADAFGAMMIKMFGKFGVILINPLDDRLKAVAGEIYARAMSNAPEFASRLVNASAQLEASGYHAQVYANAEAAPLFMLDEGRRTAMTRRDDGRFYLKGSEKSFGSAELLETIRRCPSCFSPNVTLRPIVQDFLLPTLAYIGGPAEIAYFAQLRPNYGLLNRVDPVALPRASFTLVEKRLARTMSKYDIEFAGLFAGFEEVMKTVVERSLDHNTATVFDETEKAFNDQLERLNASLTAVDPTLADALKGGREKILYQLHNLRTRFIHNRGKRDETTKQQIERLFAALYPNKNLQEREINVFYFLARYGYELIDRIYDEVEVGLRNHKLVNL
ncbi:MAG TPA: bacillithiol biosynthesis cysteine-adding enzyme BshC [Blastocatellia bacterium]|jgi:bacillithiol biosynthesis cysteine-adding enzyme BshC|nr:bacillithiol biosynthesis cysteine-adding enzyme BshC [Blastocatellia bacterium]